MGNNVVAVSMQRRDLLCRIEAGLDRMHCIPTDNADELRREVVAARIAQDWQRLILLHRSRQWLDVFEAHAAQMSDSAYWRLLPWLYSTYDTVSWAESRFVRLFSADRPGREALMNGSGHGSGGSVFESLPNEVRIYRGYAGSKRDGLSWTRSRRIAKFFAYRDHERRGGTATQPAIVSGVVSKQDILAVIDSRNESEVVVDPRRVRSKRRRVLGPLKGELEDLIS